MNKEFINYFMRQDKFPDEAIAAFNEAMSLLCERPGLEARIDRLCDKFNRSRKKDFRAYIASLDDIAERAGVSGYTIQLLFVIMCAEGLKERYRKRKIDEAVFWDSMADLRCKLLECKKVKGVWGSFVTGWFSGFFFMDRFALGRFQFEERGFEGDSYTSNGYTVNKGDTVYNFHIPSLPVPLSDEIRLDSYKRAYEFYKDRLCGKPIVFVCGSWLLYPEHINILPPQSNILKFMSDFDIYASREKEEFTDDWRVFDGYTSLPVADWPEDSSLRRAIKAHLLSGGKMGYGNGIIIFDGEKIINK